MANLLDYIGLGRFLDKLKTLFVTDLGTSGNYLTWTKNGITNNIAIPCPHDYSCDYLTFEALEDGTFNFSLFNNNEIYYSKNGGTWTLGNSVDVVIGDKVRWKGEMTPLEQDHSGGIGTFGSGEDADSAVTTISYKAYGNTMSLLYGDNFIGKTELVGNWTFNCLFRKTKITESHNVIIPATTLTSHCYWKMFHQCKQLVSMPTLVATTLASTCYGMMFTECSSLTNNIPSELPVTTLADMCYINMFYNCTSLVVAPKLPATTLTSNCYNAMFFGCSNLEVAPELPAPTLTYNCYWHMFDGCSKLNYIKCLAVDKSAFNCCAVWVKNVAANGIFIKANGTTWEVGGTGISPGVPSSWNIYSESEWEVVRHYELATAIPSKTSDLTNDSGFLTQHQDISGKADSATTLAGYGITDAKIENGTITLGSNTITPLTTHQSLTNYVNLNGTQTITGEKTFSGDKRIKFKQAAAANKLGFTLYNNSSKEVGNFEWQPSGINSKPTIALGQWRESTATAQGYVGFKMNDMPGSAYYALVTPFPADAKTPLGLSGTVKVLYFPLQFKNGSNTVLTASTGVVDLSTLLGDYLTQASFNTSNPDLAAIEGLTGTEGVLVKTAANTWALSSTVGVTPIVDHGTSDTTFELTPNIYHKWGSVSSLTLTLSTPVDNTKLNEYMFSFTSGATPTTLSLPVSVQWAVELDVEANKTYQVSIIDNLATYLTVDMIVANGDVNAPEYATKTYVDSKLALKEDVANKVTSIDENSTNTQYPSAKLVYDSLNPGE